MRRIKDIDENEILNVIKKAISYGEVFRLLDIHQGPLNRKLIKKIISDRKLDISHFDKQWYQKAQRKHKLITKTCPQCNKEFKTNDGGKMSSVTCSRPCSNIYFVKQRVSGESAKKISLSMIAFCKTKKFKELREKRKKGNIFQKDIEKICQTCNKVYTSKKLNQKFCSRKCCGISSSIRIKQSVLEGKHKGWVVRPTASYAEKYFKYRLDKLNIKYEFNKPISKSSLGLKCAACYFLDFFFPEIRLDLEIDGKQHLRPERKGSDIKRDELLNNVGIQVFRIPWVNPVTEEKKVILETRFQEFLKLYYSLINNGK